MRIWHRLLAMNAEDIDEQLEFIRSETRRCQVRWTSQRETIVRHFIAHHQHFTVDAFYEEIHAIDAQISMATVYRTLNLLVDIGVAVKRLFGDGPATFEYIHDREHHDHLIDVESGEIIEFVDEEIEELQRIVARQLGFKLSDHRLVLYGRKIGEGN